MKLIKYLPIFILMVILVSVSCLALKNPAAVYCEELGYELEIRSDEQGNQYGVCMFPDGSECEEWKYHRGECK